MVLLPAVFGPDAPWLHIWVSLFKAEVTSNDGNGHQGNADEVRQEVWELREDAVLGE